MLAERVVEWTQEWKQQGLQEGVDRLRDVLLSKLEDRFGPLPEETQRKARAIGSIEELAELIARSGSAPSLDSLGLS